MKTKFGKYREDSRGTVAIMTGLMLTAIVIGVGVAIDYNNMSRKQSYLQDVADAATIAAALSGATSQEELQKFVEDYTAAEIDTSHTVSVSVASGQIEVSISKDYELMMLGGLTESGRPEIAGVSAAPLVGAPQMDIALVLDTTGSMQGERIAALRDASASLVEALKRANEKTDGDAVRVSLVPFADYVRIDPALQNQNWIDVPQTAEFSWDSLDTESSEGCTTTVENETTTTICRSTRMRSNTALISWVGCMGSRLNGLHSVPEFGVDRLRGVAGHGSCGPNFNIIRPLSTDLDSIVTEIEGYNVASKTYIPAGLMWGWRTLHPAEPFTQAAARPEARRVMIVMSDGSNTASMAGRKDHIDAFYHWGEGDIEETKAAADTLTAETCAAIKRDNIQIISIAFQIEDGDTRTLLNNCASNSGDYYNVESIDGLERAFQRVGNGLAEVRLLPR